MANMTARAAHNVYISIFIGSLRMYLKPSFKILDLLPVIIN